MAIETATYFRRLARTVVLILIGALSLGGVAAAQTTPAVTTGSVIPLQHATYDQVYKILYWQGNILILDTASSILYQIAPGSTTVTTIVSGSPLGASGSYWNMDMAIDNEGDLYIDIRYPGSGANYLFWRVPYNPSTGTWNLTTNDGWGGTIATSNGTSLLSQGSDCIAFLDSGNGDGSGTLFWMTEESPFTIYEIQVDSSGNPSGSAQPVVSHLTANQGRMAVDVLGDIYFVENPAATASDRVNGLFFIPANTTGLSGEGSLTNLISSSYNSTNKFNGVTLDAAGNIYLTSETDSYGGTWNGELMIPNSCGGGQAGILGSACFDWSNVSMVAPVGSNDPLMVDPRGFLWIPTYGSWAPDANSGSYPGASNFVLWAMGSDNLGASPVGMQGSSGTIFVNFNTAETPGSLGFSQPGSGSDFVTVTTNPNPNLTSTTPEVPCSANPATPYAALTFCQYWLALNPRTAGPISGQFLMQDGKGNLIPGSTTYLSGVGEGPMATLLGIPAQTAMAAGLAAPAQVAVDTLGNVYVADPTLGKVLEYPAGSSGANGTEIYGPGKPTGVAVDGSGDLYIADSGSIYEIPFANGALNTTAQTTLFTANPPTNPLGNNVNLAVDGSGDVYAADPTNGQVIRIGNPQGIVTQSGYTVVTGYSTAGVAYTFKAPSAVAIDNSGDLFVADGSNLIEITPWGLETKITDSLLEPVTGLAVDPAGDVDVAEQGQILRIPSLSGTITVNDAAPIDTALQAPNSVAIDNQGNLYASDMTGGTPNVYQISINGFYNWGQVGAYSGQEQDVALFNIGNESLTLNGAPTFAGADSGDFSLVSPTGTACDSTGNTPVGTGGSCDLGVQIDPQGTGTRTATMAVATTAANASGTVTASFTANSVNNLEPTTVALSLNPTTTTFPGSTTATVTITPAPTSTTPANDNVPTGTVVLTLTTTVQGSTQPPITQTAQATGTATQTTATFNLTGIPGGTYNVTAAFRGDSNFGGGSATTTLTVAQAPPSIAITEPSGVTPNSTNNVYYVALNSNTTITATVTSTVGTPTGYVNFMNGSAVADKTQTNLPINADGQATFNLQNLQPGTYNITAVYSGDSNFATVTSSVITFQVIPPSLLLSANPSSVSTSPGVPVASTITLQSLVGFSALGGVNLTCDNSTVPQYSECTFNNPQPDIDAGGSTTSVVTLSTNIPVNVGNTSSRLSNGTSPFALAGVFGLGLLGLALRRKKVVNRYLLNAIVVAMFLAGAVMGFTGCSNSGYTTTPPAPHYTTPAGTYNVSIIATDEVSGKQYSLPFTLQVTIK